MDNQIPTTPADCASASNGNLSNGNVQLSGVQNQAQSNNVGNSELQLYSNIPSLADNSPELYDYQRALHNLTYHAGYGDQPVSEGYSSEGNLTWEASNTGVNPAPPANQLPDRVYSDFGRIQPYDSSFAFSSNANPQFGYHHQDALPNIALDAPDTSQPLGRVVTSNTPFPATVIITSSDPANLDFFELRPYQQNITMSNTAPQFGHHQGTFGSARASQPVHEDSNAFSIPDDPEFLDFLPSDQFDPNYFEFQEDDNTTNMSNVQPQSYHGQLALLNYNPQLSYDTQAVNEGQEGSNVPIDPALLNHPLPDQFHSNIFLPPTAQTGLGPGSNLNRVPLEVGDVTFGPDEQRIIVYAMSFLGYTGDQVAPVFGLKEDGSGDPVKSVESVNAAHEHLVAMRPYQQDTDLWFRDDDFFKAKIRVLVQGAYAKQNKIHLKRMKRE